MNKNLTRGTAFTTITKTILTFMQHSNVSFSEQYSEDISYEITKRLFNKEPIDFQTVCNIMDDYDIPQYIILIQFILSFSEKFQEEIERFIL